MNRTASTPKKQTLRGIIAEYWNRRESLKGWKPEEILMRKAKIENPLPGGKPITLLVW